MNSHVSSKEHIHEPEPDNDCRECHILFARELASDYRQAKADGEAGGMTCHQSWLVLLDDELDRQRAEIERLTKENRELTALVSIEAKHNCELASELESLPAETTVRRMTRAEADAMERAFWRSVEIIDELSENGEGE